MTLRCLTLTLTPSDPAVFLKSAATEGLHRTLDAPTGASLMGWAAQRCYPEFDKVGLAFTVFHSGIVRFSNAVRLLGEEATYPRPEILLKPKQGAGAVALGRAKFAIEHGDKRQAVEVGLQPMTLNGKAIDAAEFSHRLRNARGSDSLFGYEAIAVDGIRFRATVECPEAELNADQWKLLAACFQSQLALGRGRGSGYGGGYDVTTELDAPSFWPGPSPIESDVLRLWMLTDVCVADQFGAPKTSLSASDVGLDEQWTLVASESAARTRRFAPWNRAIGGRDCEMVVIEAGSTFTFQWHGEGPRPVGTVPALIGRHHERGFGRIAQILAGFSYVLHTQNPPDPPQIVAASSDLARWAEARAKGDDKRMRDEWIAARVSTLLKLLDQLGEEGPLPSQWSSLEDAQHGATMLQRPEWLRQVQPPAGAEFMTLASWVRAQLLDGQGLGTDYPHALHQVVAAARAHSQGRGA